MNTQIPIDISRNIGSYKNQKTEQRLAYHRNLNLSLLFIQTIFKWCG